MMADSDAVLEKLVALKRQRAEQHVLAIQQEVDAAEARLACLAESLKSADRDEVDFAVRKLSYQQGHIEKLLADMAAQRAVIAQKQEELARAQMELRKAFHSQDRLAELAGANRSGGRS